MSGMSSILPIALYREAVSRNEPKSKGELPLGKLTSRKVAPFSSARCEGSYARSGWILSMLLMPLM
jgi:hypothetical protein